MLLVIHWKAAESARGLIDSWELCRKILYAGGLPDAYIKEPSLFLNIKEFWRLAYYPLSQFAPLQAECYRFLNNGNFINKLCFVLEVLKKNEIYIYTRY